MDEIELLRNTLEGAAEAANETLKFLEEYIDKEKLEKNDPRSPLDKEFSLKNHIVGRLYAIIVMNNVINNNVRKNA